MIKKQLKTLKENYLKDRLLLTNKDFTSYITNMENSTSKANFKMFMKWFVKVENFESNTKRKQTNEFYINL